VRQPLPSENWYHARDHPVHNLFKRGAAGIPDDGISYPEVGSQTWSAAYPESTPDSKVMPQAWKDALNAAVQAGKIPNIPPSTMIPNQNPVYADGYDPNSPQVCSSTWKCRLAEDLWDAPDGQVGVSFDDGPLPSSDKLYEFLRNNNVKATHFFIGVNIIQNPNEFKTAFEVNQGDIAVHTWTHPYMTSLSNEDVVAQLAWTMEAIHNSTGGRVPRFWRPPYGDSDIRVSAIAREVLGLKTVIWNQDTEDWSMGSTDLTLDTVESNLRKWYTGPKSPGLIILEHELSDQTVQAFIDTFPVAVQNGWQAHSIAELDGKNVPYQNTVGTAGSVNQAAVGSVVAAAVSNSSSAAPSASGSSSSAAASTTSKSSSGTASKSSS
ncbi:glycoside hydrolase/deacetylase, partial [Amylostereum chailletii]